MRDNGGGAGARFSRPAHSCENSLGASPALLSEHPFIVARRSRVVNRYPFNAGLHSVVRRIHGAAALNDQ